MVKRIAWVLGMLLLIGGTYWIISGLGVEMRGMDEIIPDDDLGVDPVIGEAQREWEIDEGGAFFVEYRLRRDRVRDQELEMLNQVLENPHSSQEIKQEAENKLLSIIDLMELELTVENMIRAQGYDDAVFFFRNRVATVLVKKERLEEAEFIQIAEIVAAAVGIEREEVQVIARS
ncbi:MAG: SpoIIIAH-like family protein [Firmicutes bacterium]|nr:SpoIIIAH-like family protein [Bacillota bacterium]